MNKRFYTLLLLLLCSIILRAETKSIKEFLNSDGSLNLTTGWSGDLNLSGMNVILDPKKGPVAVSPNDWKALGSGIDHNTGDPIIANAVWAIGIYGTDVYVGGSFTTAGGIAALNIAKWNGSSWSALGTGANDAVHVIKVLNDDIYIGGRFTSINNISANHIVKLNGSTSVWSLLGDAVGNGVLGGISDIVPTDDYVYVCGTFYIAKYNTTNVNNCNGVARWNKTSSIWQQVGNGVQNANNYPNPSALAVNGNDVYVGGDFVRAGGYGTSLISASNIAKWNGTTWTTLGSGLNGRCRTLLFDGTTLYAGGNFTTAGGSSANYIAKWDGSNWTAMGSGFIGEVSKIVKVSSTIYANGTIITDPAYNAGSNINKWNGTTWATADGAVNNTCITLATDGTSLYAGGQFTQAGFNTPANRVAKYTPIIPVNDDCINAMSLPLFFPAPSVRRVFSTIYSTESRPNCVGVGTAKDIWFSVVANDNILRIGVYTFFTGTSLEGTNLANPVIELFSGNCSSLAQVRCGNGSTTNTETQDFDNLVPGTTYYFRIYDANGGTGNFELFLRNLPRNDECSGAITIPFSCDWQTVNGTTISATGNTYTNCLGVTAKDVWYKFSGNSGDEFSIEVTPGTATLLGAMVHVGTNCNITGAQTICMSSDVSGIVTGNASCSQTSDFYIRVFSNGGTDGTFTLKLKKTSGGNASWVGMAGDILWSNPNNWNPIGVPDCAASITINTGNIVNVNGNYTIKNLNWLGGELISNNSSNSLTVTNQTSQTIANNTQVLGVNMNIYGRVWDLRGQSPTNKTITINKTLNIYSEVNFSGFVSSAAPRIEGVGTINNYGTMTAAGLYSSIMPTFYNKTSGILSTLVGGSIAMGGNFHNEGKIKCVCGGVNVAGNCYLNNGTILETTSCGGNLSVLGTVFDQTATGLTIPAYFYLNLSNASPRPAATLNIPLPIVNNGTIGITNNALITGAGSITNSSTGILRSSLFSEPAIQITNVNVPFTNNGKVISGVGTKIVFQNLALGETGLVTGTGELALVSGSWVLTGTIAPGASPGTIIINPSVSSTASTIYQMEITGGYGAAGIADDADKLESLGNIALNGTLRLIMNNAAAGSYTIFNSTGGTISGFNNLTVLYAVNGGDLVSVKPSNVNIQVNPSSIVVNITAALPIELINFQAKIAPLPPEGVSLKAELNWQTANEINVKNFEIEKSLHSKIFEKIGEIKANNTPSVYSAFDDNFTNSAYYRLKINDLDGKISYSKTVFLEKEGDKSIKITRNTEGSILIETMDKIELITIANPIGQLIKSTKEKQFFINEFNSGIYIISVKTDKGFLSKKIFKE